MSIGPAVVEPLARAGFAVKGVVYILLGVLAVRAGLGVGGRIADPRGAIATILDEPFGRVTVAGVAIGLALYAGWRFLEAFADANGVGRQRDGIATRAGWGLSGVVYALLSVDAARLAFGTAGGRGSEIPSTLLTSPLTPWMISVVALGIIGYAISELRAGLARRLSERLNLRQLSREASPIVIEICRAGLIARAIVMVALGVVLLRARMSPYRAGTETDVSDSLRLIAALPRGRWMLVLVAAGLAAYGIYQLVHARYRRITPP